MTLAILAIREACNKLTSAHEDERAVCENSITHHSTGLVLVQPESCFGKSPFSNYLFLLQNKGLFVTFQISLDFSASQNGKHKNTHQVIILNNSY